MNGIAGIIGLEPNPALPALTERMVRRLCHGATLKPGQRTFEHLGLHIGWACSPLLPAYCVPAWSSSGDVGLIFIGEAISSRVDAPPAIATLADAYERTGLEALLDLNGAYSGIIIDLRDNTVVLFNDRYGLGRIYHHESRDGFFFASEAKALLAVQPQLRQVDPRGLAEMFAVGCVLQNRSVFSGVALLPPASAWKFHLDGRIDRHRYFDPQTWEKQPMLGATEYNQRLCELFARLGHRYLADAARIGISLTGGLDSRAVLAWARSLPGALPCYTFGGPYRDCADVVIARQLAQLCQHPHITIRVGDDFFEKFDRLAEQSVYLSDGTMDVSGAVELHVNQEARGIAPVRLTGNYGSEILRSHIAFRPGRLDRTLFTPEFNELIDQAGETYRAEAACHRLTFIAFKQVPWHHQARFSIEKSQVTPRSPFLDHELVALAYQAPQELRTSPQPLLNLIAQGNPQLSNVATDRALRTRGRPLLSRIARAWQEFTAKAEYAYDYGMPSWLTQADRLMTPLHLEKLFLGRHKFYHFRVWYRDRLRDSVREQALTPSENETPFCYRRGAARQIVEEHLSGRVNRTLELHKLLSVQLIDRLLIRQS